ncbi:SPOR domain-containing protein [Alcanivorax sp. 1008]|uniref:SPOR domain-containing protein n=1 Tax=Alcanivorax sp. 1008 TaxID=2816853 RepID=UPI001D2A6A17|nr:SPOR domain-containing protein [Alcanivorax sp. 1008]MCC1495769.1 SPOR domain-containing protein [Alcanivorax sp. 1008]
MARKPASRGASPSRSRNRKPERQVPGWVWAFSGLVCGAFVMFLYHLATMRADAPDMTGQTKEVATTEQPEAKQTGPRFDFYAVLPKMEVIIPKGEDDPAPARRNQEAESGAGTDENTQAAASRQEQYLLQAGSFRRNNDADRRRGELILHGLSARVQPVSMDNGDTWYRVMVGPFDNANAAHRAQDKLASAGIETLAIRAKTD